ncbi:MAG: aspartate dehydrogenase [Methanotrichaceae archaeon]|nr:aspartate dehydrogenase [Methanotrichaceae archaeon]
MLYKIGLVGCGAIGTEVAKAIDRGDISAELVAVCDRSSNCVEQLIKSLKNKPIKVNLLELVDRSDIVVEAASQKAVPSVARLALKKGKSLMIMSVGALADIELYREIKKLASDHRAKVYIPSGAISGLDGLKSASLGTISKITLTTTKKPASFEGAPYIIEKKIDLKALQKPTLLFEGTAAEAVKAFPANVNVAATLCLAAREGDVRVRIIADPQIKVNRHEIIAEGDFGQISTKVENIPSPMNPKTSYLAALSAIATLRSIVEPIKIGT